MENTLINIFEKDGFKAEYRFCLTTTGRKMYGGYVYYMDKFIKFIPYTDKERLTEKYLKMLVDKHIINEHDIRKQ